jgi:hypothetical protein
MKLGKIIAVGLFSLTLVHCGNSQKENTTPVVAPQCSIKDEALSLKLTEGKLTWDDLVIINVAAIKRSALAKKTATVAHQVVTSLTPAELTQLEGMKDKLISADPKSLIAEQNNIFRAAIGRAGFKILFQRDWISDFELNAVLEKNGEQYYGEFSYRGISVNPAKDAKSVPYPPFRYSSVSVMPAIPADAKFWPNAKEIKLNTLDTPMDFTLYVHQVNGIRNPQFYIQVADSNSGLVEPFYSYIKKSFPSESPEFKKLSPEETKSLMTLPICN